MSRATALRNEILDLQKRNKLLKEDIKELKLRRLLTNSKPHFPEISFHEDSESDSDDETAIKDLKRCVKYSSKTLGIRFTDLTSLKTNDNIRVLRGYGVTRFFEFNFQVDFVESSDIRSVVINFDDEGLEEILVKWKREYSRRKEFMVLMHGISQYADMLLRMRKLLTSLKDQLNTLFEVKVDVSGCVATARKRIPHSKACLLSVHWNIVWNKCFQTMADKFVLEIPDDALFEEEELQLWEEFINKSTYSIEEITCMWQSIFDSLTCK